jgi:hypothetical protein
VRFLFKRFLLVRFLLVRFILRRPPAAGAAPAFAPAAPAFAAAAAFAAEAFAAGAAAAGATIEFAALVTFFTALLTDFVRDENSPPRPEFVFAGTGVAFAAIYLEAGFYADFRFVLFLRFLRLRFLRDFLLRRPPTA